MFVEVHKLKLHWSAIAPVATHVVCCQASDNHSAATLSSRALLRSAVRAGMPVVLAGVSVVLAGTAFVPPLFVMLAA
jgi:hypothetical protein